MRADLVALGVRLGWVSADEKEEPALVAMRERCGDESEGLLLIYDGAFDVATAQTLSAIQRRGTRTGDIDLATWREIATAVEIRVWEKNVGADYLIAAPGVTRSGRSQGFVRGAWRLAART